MSEYRQQVIRRHADDWQQFFIDFRNKTSNKFNEILARNKMLYEKNIELHNDLKVMIEEIVIMGKQWLESE